MNVYDLEVDADVRKRAEARPTLAGLDGCRAGWVAVVKDGVMITTRILRTDDDLLALLARCAVVAIDIPIGLTEKDARGCDVQARRMAGSRGSSVFPAPIRPVIALRDYVEANRVSREHQDRGMSKQAFAICPKVHQIDQLLQQNTWARDRMYEIHPEVTFNAWNRAPLDASKHTASGRAARHALAAAHFGDDVVDHALAETRGIAKSDDVLDAFAALWTAERIAHGESRELTDGRMDGVGLPMRIVY